MTAEVKVGDRFEDRYRIGEVLEINDAGRCRVRWEIKREQRTGWIHKARLLTHARRIEPHKHAALADDIRALADSLETGVDGQPSMVGKFIAEELRSILEKHL